MPGFTDEREGRAGQENDSGREDKEYMKDQKDGNGCQASVMSWLKSCCDQGC